MIEAPIQTHLPLPQIKQRQVCEKRYQEALTLGLDPIAAKVIAGRLEGNPHALSDWLNPGLAMLDSPQSMADIEPATARLVAAIQNQEVIGIETDHDCDGQTSHAIIYSALVHWFGHPPEKIRSYIGHRMEEGYGLSQALLERILADETRPCLVITADNGSSDEPRIKQLKSENIDVIVTDHHAIPEEGIPASALAVLNPTRQDCQYPDALIAGCMVAWLFMAATRTALIAKGVLAQSTPSLAKLLDYVAVGTVADCVSLSRSINNRIVTRYGMKLLSTFARPCWQAIAHEVTDKVTSEDIGFKIGPLLNSDGRIKCAFGSVSFLLSEDVQEAVVWVKELASTNEQRKAIQRKITQDAVAQALEIDVPDKKSLSIFLKDGHAGVHGISASRLRETFGKPCFIFSPKQTDTTLISGSGRSTDDCHLREALAWMHSHNPDLFVAFGGHSGAAGVTIRRKDFVLFAKLFEQAVALQIDYLLRPEVLTDGELTQPITVSQYEALLATLEPFGREFDTPLFELTGRATHLKWIGQTKTHLSFMIQTAMGNFSCVWFGARQAPTDDIHFNIGDNIRIAFSFQIDTYYTAKLKCLVRAVDLILS